MHAAEAMGLENTVGMVSFDPWTPCTAAIRAGMKVPNAMSSTFGAILLPLPTGPASISIWSMLRHFGLHYQGLKLADVLAATLCTSIRRGEILGAQRTAFIDAYLAKMGPSEVVAALTTELWDSRQGAFKFYVPAHSEVLAVHLVLHCSELRADWWDDVVAHAQQSSSEDQRQAVLALNTKLSHRGQCVVCPNVLGYGDRPRNRPGQH